LAVGAVKTVAPDYVAVRLFVSVDLPDIAEAVATLQDEFDPISGIRPTQPRNTHITLKFLGEVDADRLTEIRSAVETAVVDSGVRPFDAHMTGLGAFPSGELRRLQAPIEDELTAIGFDPEDHDFTPHATVARMDHAGGKEQVQELLRTHSPDLGTQHVDHVALTESTLTDTGPEYETVARIPLSG
jgi:2'-5' RNA ligase